MINKIMFVMEKYCDSQPEHGPSNSESMLVGALISTGLVKEYKKFYFDEYLRCFGKNKMSEILIEKVVAYNPDLIIFTPLNDYIDPHKKVIEKISKTLGFKIYVHFFDSVSKRRYKYEKKWLHFVDYIGTIDSYAAFKRYNNNPKVLLGYSPVNPDDFKCKNSYRDIDVSFLGTIKEGHRTRGEYLNYLKKSGINVYISGGQREQKLSVEEYANIMNRSKISLNFCKSKDGGAQLKGRIFEAMACKSLVMEEDGEESKRLFEDGKDFVVFKNKEELLEKIKYYIKNDNEREKIAQSGYEKVTQKYNAYNMWKNILGKMGYGFNNISESNKNKLMADDREFPILDSQLKKRGFLRNLIFNIDKDLRIHGKKMFFRKTIRNLLKSITSKDVKNDSKDIIKEIEFLGYMRSVGTAGTHPQFYHINYPPEGYKFTQYGKEIMNFPVFLRLTIMAMRASFLIIPVIKLIILGLKSGENLKNVLRFIRGSVFISQLKIPISTKFAYVPTFPHVFGQFPWIVEIEDSITLFAPFIRSGSTGLAGEIAKVPCYKITKALIEHSSCKGIITHVKSTADGIPLLFGNSKLRNKVFYIPMGISSASKERGKKNKISETINILFANSWHQQTNNFYLRGGLDLLEAFSLLSKKYDNIQLILRTKLPPDLTKQCINIVQDKKVKLMDEFLPKQELEEVLSSADIYVLPAARIHVISLLEAMSYGSAVVVSDGWGFEEYIEDGQNGLVVRGRYGKTSWMGEEGLLREDYKPMYSSDRKFVDELVKALSLLIENKDLRMKLGENARRDVECKFSINNWNKGLKKVFDQIVF